MSAGQVQGLEWPLCARAVGVGVCVLVQEVVGNGRVGKNNVWSREDQTGEKTEEEPNQQAPLTVAMCPKRDLLLHTLFCTHCFAHTHTHTHTHTHKHTHTHTSPLINPPCLHRCMCKHAHSRTSLRVPGKDPRTCMAARMFIHACFPCNTPGSVHRPRGPHRLCHPRWPSSRAACAAPAAHHAQGTHTHTHTGVYNCPVFYTRKRYCRTHPDSLTRSHTRTTN